MIKYLLTVSITILFTLFLYGQDTDLPTTNGRIQYEYVDSSQQVTKEELYVRAKAWFATFFNSSKAVLEIDDKEQGTLLGKGTFVAPASGVSWRYKATFEIRVKDNKYRFRVFDILESNPGYDDRPLELNYARYKKGEAKRLLHKSFESLSKVMNETIVSVKTAMSKKDDF